MLKTRDVEVTREGDPDLTITLRALPATDASDLLFRLTSALGPAAGVLTGASDDDIAKAMPEAIRLLFVSLTPKDFREMRETLLREATFVVSASDSAPAAQGTLLGKLGGGKLSHFDMLFSGRVTAVFPVLWEALKLNFGFTDAALQGMRDTVMAAVSRSMSRPKSKDAGPVSA